MNAEARPEASYRLTVQAMIEGVTAPLAINAESVNELRKAVRVLQAAGMLAAQPAVAASSDEPPRCPVHQTNMRQGKHGGWFCPRKTEDGEYCKERA